MNEIIFRQIIERLLDNAKDALTDKREDHCEFNDGRSLAYYEVLDSIKNDLYIADLAPEDFGLGMHLEKEFLGG